ncbi:hypothetical protein ACFWBF_20290 [Streptomyces sp. NPDC060028]|uniref:hypothetical protein n=1 Tax=Streptomyces sp. NPDC060028 TaxID=3347041 RepID=UPI003673F270
MRDRTGGGVLLRRGRRGRRVAGLGVFAGALWLSAAGLFAAPPAQAAPPATGGCAGRLVKALPFATGEVRVYKTRTRACAVTVAHGPGGRRAMAVSIQPRGGAPVRDAGQFVRHAGPVAVPVINRCVYVKGGVAGGSVDSGWILC